MEAESLIEVDFWYARRVDSPRPFSRAVEEVIWPLVFKCESCITFQNEGKVVVNPDVDGLTAVMLGNHMPYDRQSLCRWAYL